MMEIVHLDASDLGNRAYLVTDGRRAMVVDPPRPVDRIVEFLDKHSLVLEVVVDTHLHNDHVTGGPELAQQTGGVYAVSAGEHLPFARGLTDGDEFAVGALSVRAVATPGHTPHHLAFVVTDAQQVSVFTGGSLLVGTAGRTDLLGTELAADLAAAQWRSIRRLLCTLPRDAEVHPTHGFGSFCAASAPDAGTSTTIGAERCRNLAAAVDEDEYVEVMLKNLPEFPSYYAHMGAINRAGPPPADLGPLPADLAAGLWIVDVRPRRAFARAHAPGTISAGVDGPLATYLGWTMPWGTPFGLVADTDAELAAARRTLAHIGLQPNAAAMVDVETDAAHMRLATFAELAAEWTPDISVIDVRRRDEWDAGHLEGAVHVPVPHVLDAVGTLPRDGVWVHCAAGYRAALGASLLRRAGIDAVAIDDVWSSVSAAGLPVRLP